LTMLVLAARKAFYQLSPNRKLAAGGWLLPAHFLRPGLSCWMPGPSRSSWVSCRTASALGSGVIGLRALHRNVARGAAAAAFVREDGQKSVFRGCTDLRGHASKEIRRAPW
jgi:hypothetical protein